MPWPRFLVVGEAPFAVDIVLRASERLGPGLHVPDLDRARGQLGASTLALIFAPDPRSDAALAQADAELLRLETDPRLRFVHRFAVVPADAPAARVRRLYRTGVSAVIAWPDEREILPDLLLELLATRPGGGFADPVSTALGKAVRARVRTLCEPGEALRATARAGIVVLAGEVASSSRRRLLQEALQRAPGVRYVVSRGLAVRRHDTAGRHRSRGGVSGRLEIAGSPHLSPDENGEPA